MENSYILEKVTDCTLKESRKACYKAFKSNIDGGISLEDSVDIITRNPSKKIHRYWRDAIIRKDTEGTITAGISSCPYSVNLNGKKVSMVAIGDVFSIKKGTDAISCLFSQIFKNNSDKAISVLYPFSSAYYSKYGYALSGVKEERITFEKKYIDNYQRGKETSLKEVKDKDNSYLKALYNLAISDINLTAERDDPLDWKQLNYALIEDGFIGWKKSDNQIRVREVYNVKLEDIFSFFKETEYQSMRIEDPYYTGISDEMLEFNNLNPLRELKLNSMVRIINLDIALKALIGKNKGKIAIKINDEIITSNNKTISISWDNDYATVASTSDYDLEMDISALSFLLVNGANQSQLNKMFPNTKKEIISKLTDLFLPKNAACTEIF